MIRCQTIVQLSWKIALLLLRAESIQELKLAGVAQLARASAFQAECREFEPRHPLHRDAFSSDSASGVSNAKLNLCTFCVPPRQMAPWSRRLRRQPLKLETLGSNPAGVTTIWFRSQVVKAAGCSPAILCSNQSGTSICRTMSDGSDTGPENRGQRELWGSTPPSGAI